MTDTIGTARAVIELDTSALTRGVQAANAALGAMNQAFGTTAGALGKAEREFTQLNTTLGFQQRQLAILRTEAAQTTAKLGAQQQQLATLQTELAQTTAAYGADSDAAKKAQQEIDRLTQSISANEAKTQKEQLALDRLTQSISDNEAKTQKEQLALDRLTQSISDNEAKVTQLAAAFGERLKAGLERASQQLTATGMALSAAFTAPFALLGKSALDEAGAYQDAMNLFQANTNATAAEMERARATAKALGADLALPGASAGDAGAVMLELAKAGLSVDEALSQAKATMQLAATEGLANAEAATIAANAYNTFKKEGLEVAQVADLLASGSSASSASVRSLSDGLAQAGAAFAGANVPLQDLITQMSMLANAGIQGSDAGTSLKAMLQRLQGPTDKAAGLMADLGLSIYDAQGNMRPMRDLVAQFTAKLGGLTQQQRDAAIVTIFGADAQRAANTVLLQGVEAYDEMFGAVGRQGTAAELAAARMKGINGAIEGFQSTVQTALLEAIEPFLQGITDLIAQASALVNGFGTLDPALRSTILVFGALLAAAGPLMLALGALGSALVAINLPLVAAAVAVAAVVAAWQSGNATLRLVAGAIGGITIATGVYLALAKAQLIPALAAQAVAWAASNAAALASLGPLAAIAAAVGGVAAAWVNLQGELTQGAKVAAGAGYRAGAVALDAYSASADKASERTKTAAQRVKDLQAGMEAAKKSTAMRGALFGSLTLDQDMATLRDWDAALGQATYDLTQAQAADTSAAQAAAQAAAARKVAAGDTQGALETLQQATQLTAEQFTALEKAAETAVQGGATAFGAVVQTELGFEAARLANKQTHLTAQQNLETTYQTDLAALQARAREATTEAERAAAQEAIDKLQQKHRDEMQVEIDAYAERERQAAEAYAREQAAQLAHLGRMLMDYATAQGQMAGVSDAQINAMTGKIAAAYGVQVSVIDRSYSQMTGSIDAWAAGGGQNADTYIAAMQRTQAAAVTMQQEVDQRIAAMTAQAQADFASGKLDLDAYIKRLQGIPGAAQAAVDALHGIPSEVKSNVTITITRKELDAALAEQRQGERGGGKRALGGPVAPNRMYEVTEGGVPELLQVGARQYLMMGSQAGWVLPAATARATPTAPPATQPAASARATSTAHGTPITITINNPVVDTTERLQALVAQLRTTIHRDLAGAVDGLILGGGTTV